MLDLIIALIVIGALLYLLQFLPIDGTIKRVIQVLVLVVALIWVLRRLWPELGLN